MEKIFRPILGFILLLLTFGFNSVKNLKTDNCETTLKVVNNRYSKSILPNKPLNYKLELKNNSSKVVSYIISSKELEESCIKDNTQKKSSTKNTELNSKVVLPNNLNSNKDLDVILLQPGQSYNFNVEFLLPKNTPLEKWNCTEVNVTSKECNTTVASVVLKTYVQNTSLR